MFGGIANLLNEMSAFRIQLAGVAFLQGLAKPPIQRKGARKSCAIE